MIDRCTGATCQRGAKTLSKARLSVRYFFSAWRCSLPRRLTGYGYDPALQPPYQLGGLVLVEQACAMLCRRHGSPHHGSRTRISNCKVRPLRLPQGYPESAEIGRLLHHTDHRPNPREAIAGAYPSSTNVEGRHGSHLGQARRRARRGTDATALSLVRNRPSGGALSLRGRWTQRRGRAMKSAEL
jgi:hypothetical protein